MSTVFMLPGQGSQYYQMGSDLFSADEHFRRELIALDQIVRDKNKLSVIDVIYSQQNPMSRPFDDALLASHSIYAIELAVVKTLMSYGVVPDVLLGSSFGTLVSSVVNGWLNEEEGVDFITKHVGLFQEKTGRGLMIVALCSENIFHNNAALQKISELAGVNFESSIVLALPMENKDKVESLLQELGIGYQALPVTRPFHSSWIDAAKDAYVDLCKPIAQVPAKIPLVCTSTPAYLNTLSGAEIWRAIRQPMYFKKAIDFLEQNGGRRYIDVGPSGSMATIAKYCLPKTSLSTVFSILSPFKRAKRSLDGLIL